MYHSVQIVRRPPRGGVWVLVRIAYQLQRNKAFFHQNSLRNYWLGTPSFVYPDGCLTDRHFHNYSKNQLHFLSSQYLWYVQTIVLLLSKQCLNDVLPHRYTLKLDSIRCPPHRHRWNWFGSISTGMNPFHWQRHGSNHEDCSSSSTFSSSTSGIVSRSGHQSWRILSSFVARM